MWFSQAEGLMDLLKPEEPDMWFCWIYFSRLLSPLFTIIDRSSRMLEAVPLANIKTETCRDTLISQWVARFSMPAHLTSEQGAQFTSALWARLCDVISTHHTTTPPWSTTCRATAWSSGPTRCSRTP
jgi:hypothetical protein